MSSTPQYAATAQNALIQISVANANRDGTGTIADIVTGAAGGSRVDDLYITATGTTTAGMIRLFLSDGTNTRLWKEIAVSANTVSATNPAWTSSLKDLALILKSGYKLKASTEKAEAFNIMTTRHGDM